MALTFSIRLVWHCLWFLQVALHLVLALLLIQRKTFRHFPIFVAYVSWRALEGIVLLGMNYAPFISGNEYAAAFTLGAAVDTVLRFGIIYEMFKHLLSGYPALCKSGTALFRWVTVALLITVVVLGWLAPAAGASHLMSGFFLLQRTVNVLLCGLLIFLFAFSGSLGLSWRSQAFGIALGLGILAAMGLATSAVRAQIEPVARNETFEIMELITHGSYLCSVLIWMGYLLLPERGSQTVVTTLPDHNLETWNQELERLLHQ